MRQTQQSSSLGVIVLAIPLFGLIWMGIGTLEVGFMILLGGLLLSALVSKLGR